MAEIASDQILQQGNVRCEIVPQRPSHVVADRRPWPFDAVYRIDPLPKAEPASAFFQCPEPAKLPFAPQREFRTLLVSLTTKPIKP